MRPRTRTCHRCHGEKVIAKFHFMYWIFALPCPTCGGTGSLPERRTIARAPPLHPKRKKKR